MKIRNNFVVFSTLLFLAGCGYGLPSTIISGPPLSEEKVEEKYQYTKDQFDSSQAFFQAGFSKRSIAPKNLQWLAGYFPARLGFFSHGDISVRCLSLEDGEKNSVGIASLDLVGFLSKDVEEIKKEARSFFSGKVLIHTTHTHSAPDVVGLWGNNLFSLPLSTGRDEAYVSLVKRETVACLKEALATAKPAMFSVANSTLSGVARGPGDMTRDESFLVMNVRTEDRSILLINYAVHPHILYTNYVSADYPYYTYKYVEGTGREVLFVNGAIGGVGSQRGERSNHWLNMRRVGTTIAKKALDILPHAEVSTSRTISWETEVLKIPLENKNFIRAAEAGLISDERDKEGRISAEINYIHIGDVGVVTFPGEAFPNIALKLRTKMKDRYVAMFGLTNSALGYILLSPDYYSGKYKYHVSVSVGSTIGDVLYEELSRMVERK